MTALLSSLSKPALQTPFVGPSWQRGARYLAVALLAQSTTLHYLTLRNAELSPVLVVVVWYAISTDVRRAAIFGLCAGFVEDALSGGTGGSWTLATSLTAICTAMLSSGFFSDSIPLLSAIVVVATLMRNAIFWFVMLLQGYPPGLGSQHLHQTLWQAALNATLLVAIMLLSRYSTNRRAG
ncbi:MAG: rod shape-determining protein MreD [Candidatus Eremiobacteraeota bacterium]|nr:rod shape-determining protein MreD [Candidatus Eremiobacteraeota bacterium]